MLEELGHLKIRDRRYRVRIKMQKKKPKTQSILSLFYRYIRRRNIIVVKFVFIFWRCAKYLIF